MYYQLGAQKRKTRCTSSSARKHEQLNKNEDEEIVNTTVLAHLKA